MKTENLTHGLFKAMREVFVIFRAFAKKGKNLFSDQSENSANFHFLRVIFAKNGKVALINSQGQYNNSIGERIIK